MLDCSLFHPKFFDRHCSIAPATYSPQWDALEEVRGTCTKIINLRALNHSHFHPSAQVVQMNPAGCWAQFSQPRPTGIENNSAHSEHLMKTEDTLSYDGWNAYVIEILYNIESLIQKILFCNNSTICMRCTQVHCFNPMPFFSRRINGHRHQPGAARWWSG